MKTFNKIFAALLIITMASCSSMKITSDKNAGFDFNSISTYKIEYAFDGENSNMLMNELMQARIHESLDHELNQRGLSAGNDPEIIITYSSEIDAKKNYSTNSTYMGGPYYGGRGRYYGGYGIGSSYSTTNEYTTYDGKLIISMYDAESGKLLWYAGGEKQLKMNSKKADEKIAKAISKIMEEFPLEKIDSSLAINK